MVIECSGHKDILKVYGLTKIFSPTFRSKQMNREGIKALNNVTFSVMPGETLGIVGESGCGKSTLGKIILRLLDATAGEVWFEGTDVLKANRQRLKELRRDMQIIFQDPYASLNPRMTVGDVIGEPIEIEGDISRKECHNQVIELMKTVGLEERYYNRFPYEFSGGQRQRICIARALALQPKLVVCDEPVSALDVSIQSQILNLLRRLQIERKLTYLFISHDLSVIRYISDRICVMYLGQIVEMGETEEIYQNPRHPYTQCLLSAILLPVPRSRQTEHRDVRGEVARIPLSKGCPFQERCPQVMAQCREKAPDQVDLGKGHLVRCHRYCREMQG